MYDLSLKSCSKVSAGYILSDASAVAAAFGCGLAFLYFTQTNYQGDSVQDQSASIDPLNMALITGFTAYLWLRIL